MNPKKLNFEANVNEIELKMSTRQRTFWSGMDVIRCQCNKLTAEMSNRYVMVDSAKVQRRCVVRESELGSFG